jgi:hypothetical protein
LAWIHAGIEAAAPFPLVGVDRATRAARDGANFDVAAIDVPAVWAFGIGAASESEPAPFKRGREVGGKPLRMMALGECDPSSRLAKGGEQMMRVERMRGRQSVRERNRQQMGLAVGWAG